MLNLNLKSKFTTTNIKATQKKNVQENKAISNTVT